MNRTNTKIRMQVLENFDIPFYIIKKPCLKHPPFMSTTMSLSKTVVACVGCAPNTNDVSEEKISYNVYNFLLMKKIALYYSSSSVEYHEL